MRTVSSAYMADKLAKDCNDSDITMVNPKDDTVITVTVNGNEYDLTPWGTVVAVINGEKVRSDGPIFRAMYESVSKRLGK